ncbi:MAG: hypothetical protein BGO70_12695 [Bacteroidetes bacterium 43-93]|nr:hypothetical protein [Bacteroidota bacterium]OJW99302.1 MAG: hypothetical protein BGO70_12695 [Bacteroidetes bacterium 43-93]
MNNNDTQRTGFAKKLVRWHFIALASLPVLIFFSYSDIRIMLHWQLSVAAVIIFFATTLLSLAVYKQLKRGYKIYFGFALAYSAVLLATLMVERIAFIIFSIPFLVAVLPDTKVAESDGYVVRENRTIMGNASYELLKDHWIYEQYVAHYNREDMERLERFHVLGNDDHCINLQVHTAGRDTTWCFIKNESHP